MAHAHADSTAAGHIVAATHHWPRGFRAAVGAAAIKKHGRDDLALLAMPEGATAAAIFTRNLFAAAPIELSRRHLKDSRGHASALILNSGCANAATGPRGLANAQEMVDAVALAIGCASESVLVNSTGVIGVQLPIEKIESGVVGMTADLQDDPMVGAEGIMTTDTHPKALSASVGDATITWVAKGSGMIEPNMATMLSYIFTDAAFDAPTLDRLLRTAVAPTFNRLSVDTDTSTSDTCAILANGLTGAVDEAAFLLALTAGCRRMTEILARDGEGAEHLMRVTVRGALNETEAHVVAKSILNSPLVKTMVHGADPNVGRLLMAVGKCFDCTIRPETTDAWINGFQVVGHGERLAFDDAVVRETLSREVVDLSVALGVGDGEAVAYGCDLTKGYVDENASYYSS
jgi:glutamate N-acetyltransferase/amino-acid N-acetyltransferase